MKINKIMLRLVILAMLLAFSGNETYTGKVIKITDGDTIVVLNRSNEQIRIRLEGIDCPESHQEYGEKAKQAIAGLCFGKEVEIRKSGTDRYGRTLAFIYVGDVCVNKYLIIQGMAWHYKKYNNDPELARLEAEAKQNKVGLWSQPYPIAPWDFRR
jgi:endonuclease YncB( thermonuclease family)